MPPHSQRSLILLEAEAESLIGLLDSRLRQCSAYGHPNSNSPAVLRIEADGLNSLYRQLTGLDHSEYSRWRDNLG